MAHICHAFGCSTSCKPECLMCLKHWRMVPRDLQREVWRTYRPGQCDDMSPSADWHEAADRAIEAVAAKEGKTRRSPKTPAPEAKPEPKAKPEDPSKPRLPGF